MAKKKAFLSRKKADDREVTCFHCGKKGHRKVDCRKLAKERDEAQKYMLDNSDSWVEQED